MATTTDPHPLGKRKRDDSDEDEDVTIKAETKSQDGNAGDEDDTDSEDSENSDSGEDNEDGQEATGKNEYDESAECYPNLVAYDDDFMRISDDLTSIPEEVLSIIEKSGCRSNRAQSCRKNAVDNASIPPTQREKIALLGSTGAGKSSLLNSLLGLPKLAKAMAAGQSCTHVATEYESAFPEQTTKFAAKVQYFNMDKIGLLLEKLLEDYHTWHFTRPEGLDMEEEQELKQNAATAFDAFRSLFCDHPEMDSSETAHEFLGFVNDDPEQDTLQIFKGWCGQLLDDREAHQDNDDEYIEANEQSGLLDQLKPRMFSTKLNEPTLWPIVEKVRIGIEGPRILNYCTIVDLPGMDDTNKVRANTCYEILNSCDSIWVVTKIARAATDTAVDNLLWRYGKTYRMSVVCTGIDDNLDPGLAAFMESEGQDIGDFYSLKAREKEIRKLAKRLPKKLETRRAKLEGRSNGRRGKKSRPLTEAAKGKLTSEIDTLDTELKAVDDELPKVSLERFETLINARNEFTANRIQEEKKDHIGQGKELRIFCVSNVHYDALKGGRSILGPRLSAESTGIPALRHFILENAAPKLLKTMENYISHKCTVFMQGLAMWANTHSIDGSVQLLEDVKRPQLRVETILDNYSDAVVRGSDTLLTNPLLQERLQVVAKAKAVIGKKEKWYWNTVRAFVRRDGNHKTTVAPKQSFNEQFMEGATKLAIKQWDLLLQEQGRLHGLLEGKLTGLVRQIKKAINAHHAVTILPTERLDEIFEAQERGIAQACDEHREALEKDFRNILLDLTQDRASGYFTQAMADAYKECKGISGHGIKTRTLDTLAAHLTQKDKKSPFAIMCKKFSQAVAKETKAKNKLLGKKTGDVLVEIHRQIDEIVEQKSDDEAEEWLRGRFREFLVGAVPKFEGIKGKLVELKGRYEMEKAAQDIEDADGSETGHD